MDDRLALRIGAFRLARKRGRTRDTAWAASRLRLDGVRLEPTEARFARAMQVKLGRALRVARIRRGQPRSANVAMPLLETPTRSRRWLLIVAAIGALVLIGALFLFLRGSSEEGGEPEGAPPSQVAVVATPPPPLRGRTDPGFAAPVAVVVSTPEPEAPAASAPVAGNGTGTVGGGTGSGGSGGGSGTGTGKGTPAPTPKPTPTPAPTVDPTGVHITGRVIDFATGTGLGGVCISIGDLDCALSPHTNPDGTFDVVLSSQATSSWSFKFIQSGYVTQAFRVPGGQSFIIGNVRLRKSP